MNATPIRPGRSSVALTLALLSLAALAACARGTASTIRPGSSGGGGGNGGAAGAAGAGGGGGEGAAGGAAGAGTGGGPSADGPPDSRGAIDALPDLSPDLTKDLPPDVSGEAGAASFVLGPAGANCGKVCGASGKSCGGAGSVGLDCKEHGDISACNEATNWIYRLNPGVPPAECLDSWGTSDVCSDNYNVFNAFCCKCL